MAHYARVVDGVVENVIIAEQEYIDNNPDIVSSEWVQTSYNTREGVHSNGGVPLRMNYAGIGFTYDHERDAFIPPKIHNSWILDEATCTWVAPVDYPSDGLDYEWDESSLTWVEMT